MGRAITLVALLCLSASLVCCQLLPTCPDDVTDSATRGDFRYSAYVAGSKLKRRVCMFVENNRALGLNPVDVTYFTCAPGYTKTRISESDQPSLFACEMNAGAAPVAAPPSALPPCPPHFEHYQKTYYTFPSLKLLELSRCTHRITSNEATSFMTAFIWVCPTGYRRQKARRGFYECVKA